MDSIIAKSLQKAINYNAYRELIKNLALNEVTTGLEQSDALINYTKLNERRMKRWDKTIKVSQNHKEAVAAFSRSVTFLAITESWCGDAAHVLPAINKVAELNDNIDLKLVLRDENLELMDAFLTNGGRSIPKVIMIDNETGEVFDTYGPRPTEATNLVNEFKSKHGNLTPEFKEVLQHWYNKNKGQNIIEDITEILNKLSPVTSL
ncbi:thioredoxin family protein [Tamlana sp. 62-3]|uniref:Thioredoxin family protein n=1 Tax=Neotamlana sargassicola TaxID=2883125 RepID=A0A9X1L3A5_9FLAO|nr:thioredoxin family protein [Tamlana sargassicola]MCB4806917.1 thioredoxin family protein [Tamlana sargassicola]